MIFENLFCGLLRAPPGLVISYRRFEGTYCPQPPSLLAGPF